MQNASLYIHVPFCNSKCIYCDFYSITNQNFIEPFLNAFLKEIDLASQKPPFGGFSFSTIYLGGGTPSLLSPQQFEQIFQKLDQRFTISKDAEISIEANPGTLSKERLANYLSTGINRLTIGIQSFDDDELKQLSRIHNSKQAIQSIENAHIAGFKNIGLDLILAIPNQSLEKWQKNVEQAVSLNPHHISMYGLTVENGTPLFNFVQQKKIFELDEELQRDMFITGKSILAQNGYEHYEISNYALPGYRSKHNQAYWDGTPYLSFGPSAHSYDGQNRWWNFSDVEKYIKTLDRLKLPVENSEELTDYEKLQENILLGLRKKEGINLTDFPEPSRLRETAEQLGLEQNTPSYGNSATDNLFTLNNNQLGLTLQGLLIYNTLCEKLIDALE